MYVCHLLLIAGFNSDLSKNAQRMLEICVAEMKEVCVCVCVCVPCMLVLISVPICAG